MDETRDQLDGLWFAVADRDRVEAALSDEAAAAGFLPIDPGELSPYGRWLQGEEDPTVRRYAVAPSGSVWTGVFPSHPDWDQELAPAIAERLGCRAASLMLHDGDVFTLQLHEAGRPGASHVSSPVHFDQPPREAGELDVDPAELAAACRPGTTSEQVREALTPPGRVDIDGRAAFEAMAALLGLGPTALLTYALLVDDDGLGLREVFAGFHHLSFRFEDEEATEEPREDAQVIRFPGGPRSAGT